MKKKSAIPNARKGPIDKAGRGLVGYAPGDPFGFDRFLKYQNWVFTNGMRLKSNSSALAALVAECSIANLMDLESAYKELPNLYRMGDDTYVEWLAGEAVERRRVGLLTLLACKRVKAWKAFDLALTELACNESLQQIYEGVEKDKLLISILADAIPFGRMVLPPALFCHVSGEQKFTLLEKSTLAREESRLAVALSKVALLENASMDDDYTLCLEAAFMQYAVNKTDMAVWSGKLTKALRPPSNRPASTQKREMLAAISKLIRATPAMGQCASLLAGFAVQLILEGTPTTSNISVGTPYDYVNSLAAKFVDVFHGRDLTSMSEDEYCESVQKLLGEKPTSKLRAAFVACHCFLRSLEVVPRLSLKSLPEAAGTAVEAKVILDHEVQKISEWLKSGEPSRLNSQSLVSLHILRTTGIRSGELLRIRLEGIRIGEGQIEFDLAPLLNDPALKSHESRRHQTISDPAALAVIGPWVERRRKEENLSKGLTDLEKVKGYLFGEPNNPRNLHKAGVMLLTLGRMMKAVTGDPGIGLHAFRHTLSSNAITEGWGHEEGDVNPLDTVAAQRGHSSAQVDLNAYFHRPELPISTHWNKRLCQFELNSFHASAWTGVLPVTLRKRVERHHLLHPQESKSIMANSVYWQALRDAAHAYALTRPGVSTGFKTEDANNPLKCRSEPSQISFRQVMGILCDLSLEVSTEVAGLRNDLSINSVNAILEHFMDVALSLTYHRVAPLDKPSSALLVLRGKADIDIDFALQFPRSRQARWNGLNKWLAGHARSDDAVACTRYWRQYVEAERIPLIPDSATPVGSLFKLLKFSGIPTDRICILVNGSSSSLDDKSLLNLNALQQQAMIAFNHPPRAIHRVRRRGNLMYQLGVGNFSTDPKKLSRQGAGFSLQGFHSLMLATLVTQLVAGEGNKK